MGALSGVKGFSRSIYTTNNSDTYRLTLTTPKLFNATLAGLSANAQLLVYRDTNNNGRLDAGDQLLSNSPPHGTDPQAVTRALGIGNYLVVVKTLAPQLDYMLVLSAL